MDSRITIIRGQGYYTSTLDTKRFASLPELEKHVEKLIAQREKLAGQKLDQRQLERGIKHADPRTPGQRAHFYATWTVTPQPSEAKPVHPFDNPNFERAKERESYEQFSERMRAQYDTRIAGKPPEDPQRIKAREVAHESWIRVAFDPEATLQQVEEAERLVKQAEACLSTFAEMHRAFADQIESQEKLRQAELSAKAAEIEQRRLPRFEQMATGSPEQQVAAEEIERLDAKEEHATEFDLDKWRRENGEPT